MAQFFALRRLHPILKSLITPLIAGAVLTILAPYGTDQFSFFRRAFYWSGLCLAGGIGAILADRLINKSLKTKAFGLRALIQSLGATLAVTPFIFAIHPSSGILTFLLTLFYIWIVAIVISAIAEMQRRKENLHPNRVERPALIDRLPPKFRKSQIYAISSEDHYVRIHTAIGEHMLLMRLKDAEDLAAPLIGLKTHRSWWVAENGVEQVVKANGKFQIQLKSDRIVPVSREGAKRVRKAGWI